MDNLAVKRDYKAELEQARLNPASIQPVQKADNYPAGQQAAEGVDHQDRLAQARQDTAAKTTGNSEIAMVQTLAKSATPLGAISLLKQVDFVGDIPFVVAMGAAILKDVVDLVAAETIVLSVVFSVFCSILIFMMLLLAGSSEKRKVVGKFFQKGGVIIAGGVMDSIPGLDFFPVETFTVGLVYIMTLLERKTAASLPQEASE